MATRRTYPVSQRPPTAGLWVGAPSTMCGSLPQSPGTLPTRGHPQDSRQPPPSRDGRTNPACLLSGWGTWTSMSHMGTFDGGEWCPEAANRPGEVLVSASAFHRPWRGVGAGPQNLRIGASIQHHCRKRTINNAQLFKGFQWVQMEISKLRTKYGPDRAQAKRF